MLNFKWESEFKETEIGKIPENWDVKKINDIGEVLGGSTPSTKIKEYWGGNISWITPKDLANYEHMYISKGERNITEKAVKKFSMKVFPQGTILLTSRAPIGYVAIAQNPLTTNQGFRNIIPKDRVVSEYICHLFKTKIMNEYLIDISGGSTFPELKGSILKEVKIPYPPSQEQQKIATVLSWFDDLIENKKKQNELLEKTAMAVFKNWFIDFEPFKDEEFVYMEELDKEIPKGWRIKSVGKLFNLVKGRKCETQKDFSKGSWPYLLIESFKTGESTYWTKNKGPCVGEKDIVLVADGESSGKIYRFKKGILGSTLLFLKPFQNKEDIKNFVYLYLKFYEKEIMEYRTGSAIPHLDKNYLLDFNLLIPPQPILQKFHSLVQPLFEKIINNQKQIMVLKKIRDALLPKLVFGKLRVEEI